MQKKDDDFVAVRREDIEALAEKLDALAASMSAGERAALARVILNAASVARSEPGRIPQFSGPLATSLSLGANFTEHGQSAPIVPISAGELRSKERAFFLGVTR